MERQSLFVVLSVAVGFTAACSPDRPTAPPAVIDTRAVVAGMKGGQEVDPVLVSACAGSAAASGIFMGQEGRYHLRLLANASAEDSAKAHAWAAAEVKRASIHAPTGEIADVVVERSSDAKYSICELLALADRVTPLAFAEESFALFDVNEFKGKIEVGLSDANAVRTLSTAVEKLGVPPAALSVFLAKAPEPTSVPNSALLRHRPVVGGIDFGPEQCTTGITGYLPGGQAVMFTASHCSDSLGMIDIGGGGWQQSSSNLLYFGTEIHDTEWSCYINGGWRRCDHAELSAYTFTGIDLNPGETAHDPGVIYRRTNRLAGPNSVGSAFIDTLFPRLVVTSMQAYPVDQQVVDAVGRLSGWSYGTIYHTCTTLPYGGNSNNKMYCQSYATTSAQGGDSGGPVFVHYPNIPPSPGGNGITFMGVLWARDPNVGAVFGSVTQMRNEVGNFYFY